MIRCPWCPYEVSNIVRFRMVRNEKMMYWYKFHNETAAPRIARGIGVSRNMITQRKETIVRRRHMINLGN